MAMMVGDRVRSIRGDEGMIELFGDDGRLVYVQLDPQRRDSSLTQYDVCELLDIEESCCRDGLPGIDSV